MCSSDLQKNVGELADYLLTVENSGQGASEQVYAFVEAPASMEFLSADEKGVFDARQNLVFWPLGTLEAGRRLQLRVNFRAKEAGSVEIRGSVRDASGADDESYHSTRFEGLSMTLLPMASLEVERD